MAFMFSATISGPRYACHKNASLKFFVQCIKHIFCHKTRSPNQIVRFYGMN